MIGGVERLEPAAAEPVQRGPGDARRQAREQRRHPPDVAAVLTGLIGGSPEHIVDECRIDAGPRDERPDRMRPQVIGSDGGKGPAVPPHRRTHRIDDNSFRHIISNPFASRTAAPGGWLRPALRRHRNRQNTNTDAEALLHLELEIGNTKAHFMESIRWNWNEEASIR